MTISKELLDELPKGCERPEDLLGEAGLMKELKIKLMERMLGAELTAHLGYEDGKVPIAVPRDREGSFEPELVKKGQTRIDGIDDKIVGLYAAGLTVRDSRAHLEDVYGLQVSPDLISRVTDVVLDEVQDWQGRALERMYPIVIFDALRVKIRDAPSRDIPAGCTAGQWTAGWSRTRRFTWRLVSPVTGCARFWAFGLLIMKAQNSGYQ